MVGRGIEAGAKGAVGEVKEADREALVWAKGWGRRGLVAGANTEMGVMGVRTGLNRVRSTEKV